MLRFTEDNGQLHPSLAVNFNDMRGVTAKAREALAVFKDATIACMQEFEISPGQMILIDNRVAVHTRTTVFTVHGGGKDR